MEYWEEVGGCCVCVPHSNKGPEFVVEEREKKERERVGNAAAFWNGRPTVSNMPL